MSLSIALVLSLLACRRDDEPPVGSGTVSLHGAGGEVWAFERRMTGFSEGCAEVYVESPRGRARASVEEGGAFSVIVPLAAGEQDVTAVCIDADGLESRSEAQVWTVWLADVPKAWARATYGDEGLVLDGGGSEPSEVRGAPIVAWTWTARAGNPAALEAGGVAVDGSSDEQLVVDYPEADGEYFVDLTVTDADGETDTATVMFRVWYGETLIPDVRFEPPTWVEDGVVYGVVPFFFGENGFSDVTAKLDHLDQLGVRTLWLSPVTDCPDDDFGYAVTDHFALRDTFGSEEDFRTFVDEAHARGMKVIMDFVPNHTSDEHPYYLAAEQGGPESPYWDFYDRDENGDATYYFEWSNLPNVNYDNPEVRRYMIEAYADWIRNYDIDGFRSDVAWGVHERAPDFWSDWRRELTRIKPDLLLLAEATARDPYYFRNGFDVAYDWTWELGEWSWKAAWDDPTRTVPLLKEALTNEGEGFDPDALVFRFLNNNDTGERFVTRYGEDLVPVAAAMLLTLPGVPCVYTGDEVGAEYEPYDEGPPIAWDDPHGFQPLYEKLIALRGEHEALHSRDFELLDVTPEDSVLGYVRIAWDAADNVLVLLNLSDESRTAVIPDADAIADIAADGRLTDLYTEEAVTLTSSARGYEVELPPYGFLILAD